MSIPQPHPLDYDYDYSRSRKKRTEEANFNEGTEQYFRQNQQAWNYFNPSSNELGKRDIITKGNLYHPDGFRDYWKNKKDFNGNYIQLHGGYDLDGDGLEDYIAYDGARDRVVGYNERVVRTAGKSERPYRRGWAGLTPEQRRDERSYKEWKEKQPQKEGFASTLPKEPTKKQTKALFSVFDTFIKNSTLPHYVRHAVIARINTSILKNVIDFSKSTEEEINTTMNEFITKYPQASQQQINNVFSQLKAKQAGIALEFRQTKVFKKHLKKVYNINTLREIMQVTGQGDILKNAYYTIEKDDDDEIQDTTKLDELIKYGLNYKELIYTDYAAAKKAIVEWEEEKAISKYMKVKSISKVDAFKQKYDDVKTDVSKLRVDLNEDYKERAGRKGIRRVTNRNLDSAFPYSSMQFEDEEAASKFSKQSSV